MTSASERTCLTASNRRRISPKISPARSLDRIRRKRTGAAITTTSVPPIQSARQRRITRAAAKSIGEVYGAQLWSPFSPDRQVLISVQTVLGEEEQAVELTPGLEEVGLRVK